MKKKLLIILSITFFLSAFCVESNLELLFPSYFPPTIYKFKNNPLDSNKINLGRLLFYDPIFSSDNSISCASCHSPYNSFAHTDHSLSHGIDDQMGNRNAPALFNLAWQKSFMWDGAINHLDMQPLAPISHPNEMNESINNIVKKLNSKDGYKKLFFKSFGDSVVTGDKVLKSLSQFQLTLISSNSKYDMVLKGIKKFNIKENKGYEIYKQRCKSCHLEPLFSTYKFANNGLAIDSTLNDYGKIQNSQNIKDSLLFKIPSLRNLSFTYPYMHDGRFKTLHQVLNHYSEEMVNHKTLSDELKDFKPLNNNQKVELIAFLLTLNDSSFIFNPANKFPSKYIGIINN